MRLKRGSQYPTEAERLRVVPVFSAADPHWLARLRAECEDLVALPGAVLVEPGSHLPPAWLVAILEGEAETVPAQGPARRLRAGEVFGLDHALAGRALADGLRAADEVRALFVPARALLGLLVDAPGVSRALLRRLADHALTAAPAAGPTGGAAIIDLLTAAPAIGPAPVTA